MRAVVLGLGLAIWQSWVSPAAAQSVAGGSQSSAADTAASTEWYGGGILVSDATTLAAWSAGVFGDVPSLGYLGLVTYLVVPQVIHGVHRNGAGIALSVSTRLGAPLIFAAIAGEAWGDTCTQDDPEALDICRQRRVLPRLLVTGGLGILTAMALDAAAFARRPVPASQSAFTIAPSLDWSKNEGLSIGVQGQF
jgi:hypothetical protein